MPLYEYECKQCHRRTEKIQKFSDAPLTECPHCGGPLERMIHPPALSFNGGGWYADLYSSSKPSGAADKKSDGGASSSSGDTSSSATASPPSTPAPSSAPAASAPSASSSDKK